MRWLVHPIGKILLALVLALFVAGGLVFIHFYNYYAAIIDARLSSPIFSPTSLLFAAPQELTLGEPAGPNDVVEWLREAGYAQNEASPVGTFTASGSLIAIHPGPEAFHARTPVNVVFQGNTIAAITDTTNQASLTSYALEPELFTTLFNDKREKRRLVHYSELPPMLIHAVLDIEDRSYFHHGAVDWLRVPTAMYRDFRSGRREQGASTITMQVARNIFDLGSQRTVRRKLTETLIAMELEQRLTKQQIFELYANQLYLGQHGSYSIHGFAEAADAYFNADLKQLTLPQCALLAGIIHGPNYDSPFRHPERAKRRRNEVLRAMLHAGSIDPAQAATAQSAPLVLSSDSTNGSEAPYFMDMVRDQLSDRLSDKELSTQAFRIYSTINPDLQAAAARAVADGIQGVDKELAAIRKREGSRRKGLSNAPAQVALVALDPHTGAVLALVGGRNYGRSQLNHVLAERPTGSIFKPFVYATALETGLLPNLPAITETSTLDDEPTTFAGDYRPANFENKYYGQVSLRTALEHSLNNATISLAVKVGLSAVTDLAHTAGIVNARPTPSEAIGTYTASPLTMAGAYTIFTNGGVHLTPRLIDGVRAQNGSLVYHPSSNPRAVIDPRIAFLTTNLMESVLNNGTAMRARAMGFTAPAAAKTGTSHDAWFAGYTSNLLCVVWVGLDDYENLNIEGAHAALPIWTEFMQQAIKLPEYANVKPFTPPPGVVAVQIDNVSNQVATPLCPPAQVETDYYLDGTQPTVMCHLHPEHTLSGAMRSALNYLHIASPAAPASEPAAQQPVTPSPPPSPQAAQPPEATEPKPKQPEHHGIFGSIWHAIAGGNQQ